MNRILLSLFCLLATTATIFAADSGDLNVGILYGDHFSYALTAPPGWVLDNESGVQQGLAAVFYPKGSSWADSKVIMYANTTVKDKGNTLDSFMKYDVTNYRENRKTKDIEDGQPLPISDGTKVPVKYFMGDMNGNFEACAYVDAKKSVAFLVLSAQSEDLFHESIPVFAKLVSSYRYLTDNVQDTSSTKVPIYYEVPPAYLQKAKTETNTPEGQKYDASMASEIKSGFGAAIQACAQGESARGDHRIVFIVNADGSLKGILMDKTDSVDSCIVPKVQGDIFPAPPYAPFYYLFELKIAK